MQKPGRIVSEPSSRKTFPISCVCLFADAASDIGELTYKTPRRRSLCINKTVSPTRADTVYANRPNTDMEKSACC
jgi:hypothetical protein